MLLRVLGWKLPVLTAVLFFCRLPPAVSLMASVLSSGGSVDRAMVVVNHDELTVDLVSDLESRRAAGLLVILPDGLPG